MFSFKVSKHISTLSETDGNITKELNLISYNGSAPKYDVRTWKVNADGERQLYKGITLTEAELDKLVEDYTKYKKELPQ